MLLSIDCCILPYHSLRHRGVLSVRMPVIVFVGSCPTKFFDVVVEEITENGFDNWDGNRIAKLFVGKLIVGINDEIVRETL